MNSSIVESTEKASSGTQLDLTPSCPWARRDNSYLATYLERDVRSLANVGSLRDFERFLRACALRSANLLNKADLARDVGIAPSTANQWLSMLEASGQVVLLEHPARYALHKLLVYGERKGSFLQKSQKDLSQAAALLSFFKELVPGKSRRLGQISWRAARAGSLVQNRDWRRWQRWPRNSTPGTGWLCRRSDRVERPIDEACRGDREHLHGRICLSRAVRRRAWTPSHRARRRRRSRRPARQ